MESNNPFHEELKAAGPKSPRRYEDPEPIEIFLSDDEDHMPYSAERKPLVRIPQAEGHTELYKD